MRLIFKLLLACTFISCCSTLRGQVIELRGTVITSSEAPKDAVIAISGNKISEIKSSSAESGGAVETNSYIFPGLIDLHDHITWNFLPRWNPGEKFNNRYEWQRLAAYETALNGPHGKIVADHVLACDADRFGEIKAIVGGATSLVGGLTPSPNTDDNNCIIGLARNLDNYSGFDGSTLNKEKVRYEVFPFEMGLADSVRTRSGLDSGDIKAFLIHVGEGKPSDAASAREFRMLIKRKDGFLLPRVSVIHGVSFGMPEFIEMKKQGVGLIWSPRSNIELYGVTTDVRSAKAAGVKIALAPDWSPSGSDGMIEELKYAASWNASQTTPVFTEAELVAMATTIPAQLAGAESQIGTLARDFYADLLLIRNNVANPHHALLHSTPADVRLVVIGGVPIYGDRDLMERLLPGHRLERISVCGKGIPETQKSFQQITSELESKLREWKMPVAELATCKSAHLN
jgi:5-methylthioadenosine/S-adenosylhomocysteine deaminase